MIGSTEEIVRRLTEVSWVVDQCRKLIIHVHKYGRKVYGKCHNVVGQVLSNLKKPSSIAVYSESIL